MGAASEAINIGGNLAKLALNSNPGCQFTYCANISNLIDSEIQAKDNLYATSGVNTRDLLYVAGGVTSNLLTLLIPVGEVGAGAKGAEMVGDSAFIDSLSVTKNTGNIITSTGIKIEGITSHGIDRVIGDNMQRIGISPESILDALKQPLKVNDVVYDSLGRPSQRFIGRSAEVVINPDTGNIISVNPTSSNKVKNILKNTP